MRGAGSAAAGGITAFGTSGVEASRDGAADAVVDTLGDAPADALREVALEIAIGASLAGSRAFCAMKHVGVNVASDALMSQTLAGVAGLIVAIGITADSFVVLFERIKDEVREGRSTRMAVETAWVRARRTIIASDVVSLLAAFFLYVFSIGNVRGFAFAFGLIFVPTFLMGALLPLISKLYAGYRGGVGRAIGQIYAGNTLGSLVRA